MSTENALRPCPACGKTIPRTTNMSWPSYAKKTACSVLCAVKVRDGKTPEALKFPQRCPVTASMAIAQAMQGWMVPTCAS